ncbi:Probable aspartate-semialdehyde dehydrogenase [Taphrina deformans PYCC 5710]|uniref:Aspartate-semialdehyde dehydrogenase n=1 Tax=Taphrina deformans (strain PYCC 5710 / ATCC 11124 / CBS 356.35 / IMI 108563 / JCM 9778 / NBRC 8474) TaxID=1097556 RepID=R4XGC6_TAPDE|nr:Probable aspartate-semialdehyde dehydrogenase [Taphrina deformans PYCC 5710]|eukprot:CCG83544.1 Probable aspartate-semialdehyde dehydrogenase [Taphrina deformans PYCC 5710]
MAAPQQTYNVGILGATGTVGQRFITLLSTHPFLKIHTLGASERSAGKKYLVATKWKQSTPCHDSVKELSIKSCDPKHFSGCDIIFSGLDHDVAGPIETAFRQANFKVFTNAKNYRRDPLVPLLVPTANPTHINLLTTQQKTVKTDGFIVANSNCSTAGVVVPMAALQATYPGLVADVDVVTMQAISGAGYPGVSSMDILDNVVPFIGGEEDKIEWESGKILGHLRDGAIQHLDLDVTASCNRVAVLDGHLACITLRYSSSSASVPSESEITRCFNDFTPIVRGPALPSAPRRAIHVLDDQDRPQPRLDREIDGGYAVSVGRIRNLVDRAGSIRGVKFVCLVHNTVLGAAGMGILNAELAIQQGFIKPSLEGSRGNL